MTTYADRELSHNDSEPVELYKFTRIGGGMSEQWLYANGDMPILFAGGLYAATPGIHRGEIQQNGETYSMTVEVDLPLNVGACITDELVGTAMPFPIRMQIIRWQRGLAESEIASIFNGEISGSYFEESVAHLTGTSEEAAWGDALGRTYCQRTCPHMLFDTFCGVDPATVQKLFSLVAINADRTEVQIVFGEGVAPDYIDPDSQRLVGGVLQQMPDGINRFIVKQVDDTVTLQVPLSVTAEVGATVLITPGCNRQRSDCVDVFDNVERFGGFPLMPDRSPWQGLR